MTDAVITLLEESRVREKQQTLYYRTLAQEALLAGRATDSERLNELHADEQHHLSRLTARVLELGGQPADLRSALAPTTTPEEWEARARAREADEIDWYEGLIADGADRGLDEQTRGVLQEILDSERHHMQELRGKWMSA